MKGPLYLVCLFAAAVIATDTVIPASHSEPQIGATAMPPHRYGCFGRFSKWCSHFLGQEHDYLTSPAAATPSETTTLPVAAPTAAATTASTSTSRPSTAPLEGTFPIDQLPNELIDEILLARGTLRDKIRVNTLTKGIRNRIKLSALEEDTVNELRTAVEILFPSDEVNQKLAKILKISDLSEIRRRALHLYGEEVDTFFAPLLKAIRYDDVDAIEEALQSCMLPEGELFHGCMQTAILWQRPEVLDMLLKNKRFDYVRRNEIKLAGMLSDVHVQRKLSPNVEYAPDEYDSEDETEDLAPGAYYESGDESDGIASDDDETA